MVYRRKFYRRRPRKYVRRTKRTYRKKTNLRKFIRRVVDRRIETKQYASVVMNQQCLLQTNGPGIASNTSVIIPSISQSTALGGRIGDRIDLKSLRFKLWLANYAETLVGVTCRVIIFSLKDYQQSSAGSSLPSVEYGNFFRNGASSGTASGYIYNDTMLPLNKERLIVHHERIVILGQNINPGSIVTQAPTASPSIPGAKMLSFNLLKGNKVWRYDENGVQPNLPLNQNLWCAVLVNSSDGSVGTGASQVSAYGVIDIHYKDA